MSDLFDREFHASRAGGYSSPGHVYPNTAWHKGAAETSREAAEAINKKLGGLQRRVFDAVAARGANGLTPEEAADLLAESRVSVQPRFSELKAKGLIADSGQRRVNPSSRKRAVVWVIRELAPKMEVAHG